MATCPACGTPNVDGVKFCVNCGAQLAPAAESWRTPDTDTVQASSADTNTSPASYPSTYNPPPQEQQYGQPPMYQAPGGNIFDRMQQGGLPQTAFTVGIVAVCLMGLGLIPCLGWLNWFTIPVSLVALVLGIIALVNKRSPDIGNKATIGTALGGIALVIGFIRLGLGGGCI